MFKWCQALKKVIDDEGTSLKSNEQRVTDLEKRIEELERPQIQPEYAKKFEVLESVEERVAQSDYNFRRYVTDLSKDFEALKQDLVDTNHVVAKIQQRSAEDLGLKG